MLFVAAGTLLWRPTRYDRVSIFLLKINALRSAASSQHSNVTAKEGHVNYDISDVPIEARAAPTTGSGCFGWIMACAWHVIEYSFLLLRARALMAALQTPPTQ